MDIENDKKIYVDIQYSLEEAFDHVQKFFGTPEKSYPEKTRLEYEEDTNLKAIAFKAILEKLLELELYVEGS